ncbi:autotransporter assembly complex protein TamA [Pseudoxanthomonas dokdonensis]|uniref:Translocation and assembly module subunit TamA n=1 Tax=Pseudoxanthomonas dokdonensis TaxID=344882 RepID=A0A0R0CEQ8_9GAMM|nr:outer membrane protein assembly factor [Pseudoxanthomonas dokdonensis]KRG68268.1 hypothetical protein ABB29_13115 [Pseudoxanthomonas dokdonensis]
MPTHRSHLRTISRLLPVALMSIGGPAWAAATVNSVTVTGLEDELMEENIQLALTLNEMKGRRLREARFEYLLQEAVEETRTALEPFGYYSPVITISVPRKDGSATTIVSPDDSQPAATPAADGSVDPAPGDLPAPEDQRETRAVAAMAADAANDPDDPVATAADNAEPVTSQADAGAAAEPDSLAAGDDGNPAPAADSAPRQRAPAEAVDITIHVQLGEPVRVRNANLRLEGPGEDDRYLKQDLAAFTPLPGQRFDHTVYETSKLKIVNRLAERGYFDSDFLTRRVEVTRAEHAADIDLSWATGIRYDMGPTRFNQDYFDAGLLEQLVYWDEGSYFHQGKLDRLRESLVGLDYFSNIDIRTDPDKAVEGRIPVEVNLTRAKRTVYTAGLSYGTENGPGIRLGLDRRYVNSHGHKLAAGLDYTRKRKILSTDYRIPAFAWLDGWYRISALYDDDDGDYINSRRYLLTGSRSGQINEHLKATASINWLNERWFYDEPDDGGGALAPLDYSEATFLYPALRADYVNADDLLFPQHGIGIDVELRGAVEGVAADASFIQLHATARWYQAVGDNNRLIVRGEAGHTYTDELFGLPPSLRFFAGGDRSIRGYGYREVGPTSISDQGDKYALGAKNVLTASVEFERYFNDSWGAAVFVDSGDAFDDTPDFRTGVGIGARWKSPVGPVRVDVARGLNDPDSALQLYLNIGADW